MGKHRYQSEILKGLSDLYPEAKAELNFTSPFELLIATILSAQCTDIRVNKITAQLFKVADTPEKMAALELEEIIHFIRSCGMYRTKGKFLKHTAMMIMDRFEGRVPETIDELMMLPGVGRKTANVVASNAFGVPAIAVDTHVFRVSNRLGLANASDVTKTEMQLMETIDKNRWILLHHQLIYHGRRVCKARSPMCAECTLAMWCREYQNK
jgi:endonuclease-3